MTRPIVGVSLPKFGTTAKIVVGWTEKDGADENVPVGPVIVHPININNYSAYSTPSLFTQKGQFTSIRWCIRLDGSSQRSVIWTIHPQFPAPFSCD